VAGAKRNHGTTKTVPPILVPREPPRARRLSLVHSVREEPLRFVRLSGERVVIGRAPGAGGFEIAGDLELSRRHVEIKYVPEFDAYRIADLGSKNGTYLNGRRMESDYVQGGAVIRIGGSILILSELPRGADRVPGIDALTDPERADPRVALSRSYAELLADRAAPTDTAVLIQGPTGSGKEVLARRIHERSGRPGDLVTLNCATLSRELIASEMFGHTKGAFSGASEGRKGLFAEADGGTLFLDEIAELPLDQQASLLRAIQEKRIRPVGSDREIAVDVRVVAATHQDLDALEARGQFRSDLLGRLAGLRIELRGLIQRREEILIFFAAFLGSHAELELEAAEALLLHDWPKNLRELRQAAEAIRVFHGGVQSISVDMLPAAVQRASNADLERPKAPTKEELEARLTRLRGNVAALAKEMGEHRNQLYRWFEAFAIDPERFRGP
jgi:MoxR-like ATPase